MALIALTCTAVLPQHEQSDKTTATIYIYRYKQFVGSGLKPSVYCDDTELARMENGSYLVISMAPSRHSFRSNDKQAGVEIDLKPGEDYYMRVELVPGVLKGHGRIVLAQREQGAFECKKLRRLSESKVNSPH